MTDSAEWSAPILVVDDDDNNRELLKSLLENEGYEVILAVDGFEAVEKYQTAQPSLILMDVVMPRMDGMEATRRIRQLAGDQIVPVIFLSFLDQEEALAKCIEAGGDDFLPKPYNRVILKAKVEALLRLRRLHDTVSLQRDELMIHRERLEHEHEVAERIFGGVAHPGSLDQKQIRYLLHPTSILNGDLLLAARQPDGGMLFLIGDGTGHGLPAAVTALPVAETFYAMAVKGFPIEEILREIHQKLRAILPEDLFFAACLFHLDREGRFLRVWNGGMPNLLIVGEGGVVRQQIESKHLPLGIGAKRQLDTAVDTEIMQAGERIYAFSDGVIETENGHGERYGIDRVTAYFRAQSDPERWFEGLMEDLKRFRQALPPRDDTTLIEVSGARPFSADAPLAMPLGVQRLQPLQWHVELELTPPTLRETQPVPHLVQALIDMQGLRAHRERLYTVLAELYSNALEHGLLELDSQLKTCPEGFHAYYRQREERLSQLRSGSVRIVIGHRPNGTGGQIEVIVEDSGSGFDLQQVEHEMGQIKGYYGRGILLVRGLCKELRYPGNGSRAEAYYEWS